MSQSPIVKVQQSSADSAPAKVSSNIAHSDQQTTLPKSTLPAAADEFSPTMFLLDCVFSERVPLVGELFNLMEHAKVMHVDDPVYAEALSELHDHKIKDVVDLYSLGTPHLATFGSMGRDRANLILEYARDRVLTPLGFMRTKRSESSEPSVVEVDAPEVSVRDGPGWTTIKEEYKDVLNLLEDEEEDEGEEDVDELEGMDSEGDEASDRRRSESFPL